MGGLVGHLALFGRLRTIEERRGHSWSQGQGRGSARGLPDHVRKGRGQPGGWPNRELGRGRRRRVGGRGRLSDASSPPPPSWMEVHPGCAVGLFLAAPPAYKTISHIQAGRLGPLPAAEGVLTAGPGRQGSDSSFSSSTTGDWRSRALAVLVDAKGITAAHLGSPEKGAPGTGHPSGLVPTSLDDFLLRLLGPCSSRSEKRD